MPQTSNYTAAGRATAIGPWSRCFPPVIELEFAVDAAMGVHGASIIRSVIGPLNVALGTRTITDTPPIWIVSFDMIKSDLLCSTLGWQSLFPRYSMIALIGETVVVRNSNILV